jgi:hypothetical protein
LEHVDAQAMQLDRFSHTSSKFFLLIILNLCEPMVAQEKTPAMSDSAHKYLE